MSSEKGKLLFPKKGKPFYHGIPTAVLALIVTLLLFPLMFFLSYGLIKLFGENAGMLIGYILWFLAITAACFFLCHHNPASIWYVPVICNMPFIISAIVESYHWEFTEWILMCCGWGLSLATSIAGSIIGRKTKPGIHDNQCLHEIK